MTTTNHDLAPQVSLTIGQTRQGDVEAHAATCADLGKGRLSDTFDAAYGTSREAWVDYNCDFLEEGGVDAAWPIRFLPCCFAAGLVDDPDRTY